MDIVVYSTCSGIKVKYHVVMRICELNANVTDGKDSNSFVDRQNELDELCRVADLVAKERRSFYAFIQGKPGIGKTTVIDRFLKIQGSKRGNDVRVLRVEAQDGYDTPFYPFANAAKTFVKENPNMVRAIVRITSAIIECIPGVGQNVTSALDTIENVRDPRDMERYETDQVVMLSRYPQMIESIANNKILILCIDDAQWLDVSSRMLLGSIISKNMESSILFVIAARITRGVKENANLNALARIHDDVEERSTSITVKPFTEEFYPELIRRFRSKYDLEQELMHEIYEKTHGNPYWLRKVLSGPVDGEIPARISDDLGRKIDEACANMPKAQEILRYAAVLGHRFDLHTISKLTGTDMEEAFVALGQLKKFGLVDEPGSQEYFTFDHDITREHVYRSLNALRKHYHKNVAEFLEHGGSPNPYSLAYHYSRAGCKQSALRYMRAAARASVGFPLDAIEKLEECIEIAQDLSMGKEEIIPMNLDYARALLDLKRAKITMDTASASARTRPGMDHVKRSMDILKELIGDECTPNQEKATAHVIMSRCHRIIDTAESGPKAIKHAQIAIGMLQGGAPKSLGDAYAYLATVYDHFEADGSKTKQAYMAAGRHYKDHPIDLARLHRKVGMVVEARVAIEIMKKSLKVFEDHGMSLEKARCLNNIGSEYLYVGSFEDSTKFLQRSKNEFEDLGTHEIDIPLNNLGLCHLQRGDYETAMRSFLKAQELTTETYNAVFVRMNVSTAHRKMGRLDEAVRIMRGLENDVMDLPEPTLQDYYGFNRGITHRDLGEWDEAKEWFRKFPANTYKNDHELVLAKRTRALFETCEMQGGIQEIAESERVRMEEAFATTRPQKWLYETDYYPCDLHIWA